MSSKVKSTGSTLMFRGFRSDPQDLDHGRRIKFSQLKGPKGVEITDEITDAALAKVQSEPNIQQAHRNSSGEIIITPKTAHSASTAVRLMEHLKQDVFRLIVNAIIAIRREAKRQTRQIATAKNQKAGPYVNDKSRTSPAMVPVT